MDVAGVREKQTKQEKIAPRIIIFLNKKQSWNSRNKQTSSIWKQISAVS